MSLPANPLDDRNSYTTYFVLAAFKTTTEAESAEDALTLEVGPEGSSVGNGIVIINDAAEQEKAPTRFFVVTMNYDFTWSSDEVDNTISGGSLTIGDTSAGDFLTFLHKEIITKLGTSLENITFALKIFWNYPENDIFGNDTIIKSKPLYFSIPEIEHKIAGNQHFYQCGILPLYNAKAHSTNYSRIYSMSITHKGGELHEEQPVAKPIISGIIPRSEEDEVKNEERLNRINKSKPMKNLEEAYNAFENELNESVNAHQGQFQKWQKTIRTDHVNKLEIPNQVKDIPITYTINLSDDYKPFTIDNRNLPFEQPEQSQIKEGVRVIPTIYGEKIDQVIDRIMEYSKKVGEEARGANSSPKDYKVCKVWRRKGDQVLYDIVVEPYVVPFNFPQQPNTGPGEGAVKPFTYFFKKGTGEETDDVMMFDGILHRSDILEIMEEVQDEPLARLAYGAEREEISAEREPGNDFFKSGYSGHRAKVSNQKVLGVEYPRELADTIKRNYVNQNIQQSAIEISIHGNPDLLSDLFRKPSDVASGSGSGAKHYSKPEIYPMYAKVFIAHSPSEKDDSPENSLFYHQNWMHIYKIETSISNGSFLQKLTLLRNDEVI